MRFKQLGACSMGRFIEEPVGRGLTSLISWIVVENKFLIILVTWALALGGPPLAGSSPTPLASTSRWLVPNFVVRKEFGLRATLD